MYNPSATIEKRQAKARTELKRKQRKLLNREKRYKEEHKNDVEIKKDEVEKTPSELYGHLSRAERKAKEIELGVKIVATREPVKGKQTRGDYVSPVSGKPSTLRIVPIHYEISMPVSNWLAIKDDAEEMARIMDEKVMKYESGDGYTGQCVALHHSQVSNKPFNYFVFSNLVPEGIIKDLGSRYIVNPKIESVIPDSMTPMKEACVSFPYKSTKTTLRAMVATVEYQIPDDKEKGGLKTMKKQVAQVVAQIFQHECDHAVGVNMYYKTPKVN